MQQYVIYLRKSRADAEAEARGEGETLARHEKTLIDLAKKLKLNVTEIYRELVSGETIAARPMMQKLLSEVEKGIWDGVLVMEVERLARGDTIDQGIMAQTFKISDTKIITPVKTYDPNNEYDEEYFEFGLFMSRREYKTINRRLQRGRLTSVKEGKYVANQPPYGYVRKKLKHDKGYTLEENTEQASVIRMIFEWYTTGDLLSDGSYRKLGPSLIARKLNQMKVKPQKGDAWVAPSIRDILINPVYIGKIRWNWRPATKKMEDGKVKKERPRSEDVILVEGLHKGIIPEDVFYLAARLISRNNLHPIAEKNIVMNPLSGIVVCGRCDRKMVRRPYSDKTKCDTLMCPAPHCTNISARLISVESAILNALGQWLSEYRLSINADSISKSNEKIDIMKSRLDQLDQESIELHKQLNSVYELLEKGVYSTEQFLERSKLLAGLIDENSSGKNALANEYELETSRAISRVQIIPKIEYILNIYRSLPTAQAKNDLLKEVLEKVVYVKERSARYKGVSPDDFTITLYPILPIKNTND
jgi:DNA invertase Pin-like site-specific DNA recombinase